MRNVFSWGDVIGSGDFLGRRKYHVFFTALWWDKMRSVSYLHDVPTVIGVLCHDERIKRESEAKMVLDGLSSEGSGFDRKRECSRETLT